MNEKPTIDTAGLGPGNYKRLSYDEFRTLRGLGPDVFHHAVVAMGLRGEVENLTGFLKVVHAHGMPMMLRDLRDLSVTVLMTEAGDARREPKVAFKLDEATLDRAITSALAHDPDSRGEPICEIDVGSYKTTAKLRPQRTGWSTFDEALIRAAVAAFDLGRPDVLSDVHLRQFHANLAVDVNHPRTVPVLLEAGVSPATLWDESPRGGESATARHRGTLHPINRMIRIGNLSAAASMVGALPRVGPDGGDALQLAHAKGLISAWLGLEHHTLTAAAAAVTPPTPESPDLGGTVGDVHGTVAAACRLFDEVQSRWPDLGLTLKCKFLQDCLYKDHHAGRDWDADLVRQVLHTAPADQSSLAQHWAEWRPTAAPAAAAAAAPQGGSNKPENTPDSAAAGLIVRALSSHAWPVIEAARPLLVHSLNVKPLCGDAQEEVKWACDQADKPARIVAHDAAQTFAILKDVGFNLTGQLELTVGPWGQSGSAISTSALHMVATSAHADRLVMMVALMDLGADPAVKNQRGRVPATAIADKGERELWLSAQRSCMARREAEAALADLDANRALISDCRGALQPW